MSVRQAILDFTGGEIRPRIFVAPSIPDKKLAAAKAQFAFGDEKVIALYDDTLFGSGKDGIAVTESYLYAKQLWENPRSVKLSSIKTITTESKLLDNLDIFVNGNFFTSISTLPKADQPFLLGLLLAARNAAAEPKAQRKKANSAGGAPQAAAPKAKAKGRKSEPTLGCSECSAQLPKGAKFCLECGTKVMPKGVCLECNAKLPEKAKFCPECGAAAGKTASQPAQPKVSADELRKELALWLSASEMAARIDSDGDLSLNISAPAPSFARDTRGWIGRYDLRIDAEGVNAETTEECACFGQSEEFSVSSPYCRVGMQASAAYDVAMKLQVYTLDELEVHEIELKEGALAIPKLSSSRVRITNLSARRDDDGSYEIAYELDAYAGHAVHFQVSAEKPDADGTAWARVEEDDNQSGTYWLWDVKPGQKLYVCFGEYKLLVDGVEASFSGTADAPEGGYENAPDDEHHSGHRETLNEDAVSGDNMDWQDAAERAFNYYFNAIRKGEDSDTAAEWFNSEITEQTEAAGISYDFGWHEEVSPEQMRILSDTLASRIRALNDEQGYSVSAEFYQQFTSFVSNLIYDRRQASDVDLDDLQSYWDEGVWKELPTYSSEGYLNSPDDEENSDGVDDADLHQKEAEGRSGNQMMNFELKVVYRNADTGHYDEQFIEVSTEDEKIQFLGSVCSSRQTPETFDQLFRAMYDNPTMDGAQKGALYDELWPIMSRWAFDKLGWHDVTVSVIGLKIDHEDTKLEKLLEAGMVDDNDWALQLSREGYMYCYV